MALYCINNTKTIELVKSGSQHKEIRLTAFSSGLSVLLLLFLCFINEQVYVLIPIIAN